jgi:hypothetical protein
LGFLLPQHRYKSGGIEKKRGNEGYRRSREKTDGRTTTGRKVEGKRWTKGRKYERTEGRKDGRVGKGRKEGRMKGRSQCWGVEGRALSFWNIVRMDGRTDGRTYRRTAVQTDGRTDGRTEGNPERGKEGRKGTNGRTEQLCHVDNPTTTNTKTKSMVRLQRFYEVR